MKENEAPSVATDQKQGPTKKVSQQKSSREGWYGVLLLIFLGTTICIILGAIGWWTYVRLYLPLKQEKVSIDILSQEISPSSAQSTSEDTAPVISETEMPKEDTPDIKQEIVLVLNGGGVKGSAGEVVSLLKKEGYSRATIGNSEKNYTGVTIYFDSKKEKVATEMKKLLLKRYPKATSRVAMESDKETTGAPIVIIIGK